MGEMDTKQGQLEASMKRKGPRSARWSASTLVGVVEADATGEWMAVIIGRQGCGLQAVLTAERPRHIFALRTTALARHPGGWSCRGIEGGPEASNWSVELVWGPRPTVHWIRTGSMSSASIACEC